MYIINESRGVKLSLVICLPLVIYLSPGILLSRVILHPFSKQKKNYGHVSHSSLPIIYIIYILFNFSSKFFDLVNFF